jgi:hypothetical protein
MFILDHDFFPFQISDPGTGTVINSYGSTTLLSNHLGPKKKFVCACDEITTPSANFVTHLAF